MELVGVAAEMEGEEPGKCFFENIAKFAQF